MNQIVEAYREVFILIVKDMMKMKPLTRKVFGTVFSAISILGLYFRFEENGWPALVTVDTLIALICFLIGIFFFQVHKIQIK